jgi:hypothetical protein
MIQSDVEICYIQWHALCDEQHRNMQTPELSNTYIK